MIYSLKGEWKSRRVWLDEKELFPERSQKVFNHSPNGFNWSYSGSGCAQLALAICLEICSKEKEALFLYQIFKEDIISDLPSSNFDVRFVKENASDHFFVIKIGYCENCRYWESSGEVTDMKKGRGICMNKKIANVLDLEYKDKYRRDILVWSCGLQGVSDSDINIFTGPYFGCVHFKKKK